MQSSLGARPLYFTLFRSPNHDGAHPFASGGGWLIMVWHGYRLKLAEQN